MIVCLGEIGRRERGKRERREKEGKNRDDSLFRGNREGRAGIKRGDRGERGG